MKTIFIFYITLITSFSAFSNPVVEACSNCSVSQEMMMAHHYGLFTNTPYGESEYHILNTATFDINTYQILKMKNPDPKSRGDKITNFNIPTPSALAKQSLLLKAAADELSTELMTAAIPSSVIPNPWFFVNCAFCGNDTEAYLQKSPSVSLPVKTIGNILKQLNMTTIKLDNQYEIPLAVSGIVLIKVAITNSGKLFVEPIEVIDQNNNRVPFSQDGLNYTLIRISPSFTFKDINEAINPLGFYIPTPEPSAEVAMIKSCKTNKPSKEKMIFPR